MSQDPWGYAPQQPQFAPQQPQFAPQQPQFGQPQFAPQQPQFGQPQFGQPQFGQPFAPQQFGQPFAPQQFGQPFAPPQQALPPGSLAAFRDQPKTGRPNSVSWKNAPLGSTITGVVLETPTDQDVVVDTDPQTKAVKTYRDGSPRYVLVLTLQLPSASQAFPEGTASLYCRGGLWQDLQRALTAAGRADGLPARGDRLALTLVERRQGRGAIPRNVFDVKVVLGDGTVPQAPTPVEPYGAQPSQQFQQPPAQFQQPPAQFQQSPAQFQQPPAPQFAPPPPIPPAPVQQAPAQQAPAQQAPAQQAPAQQAPAPSLDPAQAAMLAQFMQAQQPQ